MSFMALTMALKALTKASTALTIAFEFLVKAVITLIFPFILYSQDGLVDGCMEEIILVSIIFCFKTYKIFLCKAK